MAQAQISGPAVARNSDLVVRLEAAGNMTAHKNPTAPVVTGDRLLLVDQAGVIEALARNGTHQTVFDAAAKPSGMTWVGGEPLLGVAASPSGAQVYVVFIASEAPTGIPKRTSARPETDAWQVLYRFDLTSNALVSPKPIAAFQVRSIGHTGGGLACLPDGSVLLAIGDNGDASQDGLNYPDDPGTHLGKILRIDPATGASTVVARGVRNPQRLVVYGTGAETRLDFIDLGGWVAEELNSIPIARLLADAATNHFGWGVHRADRRAREGTFVIDAGGRATGPAPRPDPGFLQPVAQFGRETSPSVAGSGPVSSAQSFTHITSLFGDLISGAVYATTAPLSKIGQEVLRVALVDRSGARVTLSGLAGGRPDPRFFNFPDGAAGVLLERTGALYRLTELPPGSGPVAAVAAPAGPPDAGTRPGPSVLKASFTDAPITVDGVLDEPAWASAGAQGDFRFPWGDTARGEASSIRVIWSADAVYVGARMSDKHVVAAGKAVGAMYSDDMIELHLAPDAVRSQVFFLYEANLNNIANAQFRMSAPDGTNQWFKIWDTAGVVQASKVIRGAAGDEAWVMELKIPFATLDRRRTSGDGELPFGWKAVVPPVNGTTWKFNVTRANRDSATGPDDYSVWSFNGHYAYGPGKDKMHFHDQNNFGTLTFVR
jgi:hypothetical protein